MSTPTDPRRGAAWKAALAGDRPLIGMWVVSGSPLVAEVCAGSGLDWLLIDSEHAANDLVSIVPQLQASAAYPITTVVRPPTGDPVQIKQLLDAGAEVLLIPMVESAEQARDLVAATRYPPRGYRGVGSAFARASRWNRIGDYLGTAEDTVSLIVQVESQAGLDELDGICAVDGVDGVFVGPADLAASMGHLGQPEHPQVVAAVDDAIARIIASGKAAGVNAFAPERAQALLDAGVSFILTGADLFMLARGSEQLARQYRPTDQET